MRFEGKVALISAAGAGIGRATAGIIGREGESERLLSHWEKRSAEGKAAEIERTPLDRVATPTDQARVICFLASADADFVTGVTMDVTGGQ